MTSTTWLPKFLRWMFTVFTGATVVAGAVILFLIVNPSLFSGHATMQIAPVTLAPAKGAMTLKSDTGETIQIEKFDAAVSVKGDATSGLANIITRRALPVALVYVVFFTFLFDMLRRLFRNVARAESFTERNLRLVRMIGYSMLVFSLLAAGAEAWVGHSFVEYMKLHTSVASLKLQVVEANNFQIGGGEASFQWTWFLTGLLVLALAEVFRQGHALKRENDLTV
jgi:hypothetical protein